MQTAALDDGQPFAAEADGVETSHPSWRKIVASAMIIVFALTLAATGFLLCSA
jgi:anti-sigma-K factor RskA